MTTHTATPAQTPPGLLLIDDVARVFTEEARKQYDERVHEREKKNDRRRLRGLGALPPLPEFRPISPETVRAYRKESKPFHGRRPGRYANNPMPPPGGYVGTARQAPWWPAADEQKLRDWWNSRPGYGHGTGGRYAGRRTGGAR